MLNLTLPHTILRKAGAKLQLFHETNKSFAKFYIICIKLVPYRGKNSVNVTVKKKKLVQ